MYGTTTTAFASVAGRLLHVSVRLSGLNMFTSTPLDVSQRFPFVPRESSVLLQTAPLPKAPNHMRAHLDARMDCRRTAFWRSKAPKEFLRNHRSFTVAWKAGDGRVPI